MFYQLISMHRSPASDSCATVTVNAQHDTRAGCVRSGCFHIIINTEENLATVEPLLLNVRIARSLAPLILYKNIRSQQELYFSTSLSLST